MNTSGFHNTMLALVGTVALAAPAVGEAPRDDKRQYHLFHPVPADQLRPLSTDRPDLTEGPYTVDPGHFQVEWDFLNFSYDRRQADGGRERVERYAILPFNFKLGLWHNVDLQFEAETFVVQRERDRSAGTVKHRDGFGDLALRLKVNLWGNDAGATAFGVMPFVKFPTAADGLGNGAFEGGVIFPFAAELPHGWELGLMTEFDVIRDSGGSSHHVEFVNSIALGHDIVGALAGYVELFTVVSTENTSDWVAVLGVGLTYAVTDNFQLDGGVNFGLTRAAETYNPFVGASVRF
jgi:hypothetical protein